ncbi:TlpA disulfide reductase family protein [Magnetovibrio blakemorei]|uniref:TlpA disulfide reductase family protein n=1 Tax=Magnetovibrio blakemorei TaxID=28181 RepID=UPI000A054E10|nr:TlpA family protein disulfide reductase [Magnetovibrio blakemorei]
MFKRTPVILLIAFVCIAAGGGVFLQSTPKVPVHAPNTKLSVAEAADQLDGFSLLTDGPLIPGVVMKDEAGQNVTFEAFRGKIVVFNLWATWCPPCIAEMPDLNALQNAFSGRDFAVVPVASGKQGRETPADFLRKRKLMALTTYYDPDSKFLRTFDLDTLPTTFVLDKTGRMRGGVIGMADWQSDEAKALIEAFLNE